MTNLQKGIKYGALAFGIFLIVSILSAILGLAGAFTMIGIGGTDSGESFTETYENVRSIDIDVSYSSILIEKGEEFKVDATNVSRKFSSKVKNDTLIIKEKKNWFFNGNSSGTVVITIPEEEVLHELTIDSGAGTIELDQVIADLLEVSQGAGVLTIQECDFSRTEIDGGAGKIEITSSMLNNLELDAGVGKVEIEAMITGNSSIDCGVGEIRIVLLGDREDYRIRAEKGVGSIQIDGTSYSNDTTVGGGANFLELDGGVGSVVVDFNTPTIQ